MKYKDRAWCSKSITCRTSNCDRYFGIDEREKAISWWGGEDFPVAMSDFSQTCGEYAPTFKLKEDDEI